MTKINVSEAAKAVVRRNTEEVQGGGNFEVFEELFADDFLDHTPQPGRTPDKAGARELYKVLRAAFPDFHADIHWQLADGDRVTTYKTYHGTHKGEFFGIAPTGRKIAVRDRGRDARARRQDRRALGRGQSLLSHAAARRASRRAEGVKHRTEENMTMSIGIIGAGNIGLAVAKTLARAGIAATIANSRGPDSLEGVRCCPGPDHQGRNARASRQRRHRLDRGQLVETAGGRGGAAGLGRTDRHRRQQSDRSPAVQAGRFARPCFKPGGRRPGELARAL